MFLIEGDFENVCENKVFEFQRRINLLPSNLKAHIEFGFFHFFLFPKVLKIGNETR